MITPLTVKRTGKPTSSTKTMTAAPIMSADVSLIYASLDARRRTEQMRATFAAAPASRRAGWDVHVFSSLRSDAAERARPVATHWFHSQ